MIARPKQQYFRSRKHLMNVASLPCQNCYVDGQTQASHSNWVDLGRKGRGLKSSDEYTAALCQACHMEIDSGARLNKEQRRDLWVMAWQKTMAQLKGQGKWPDELK
jgi:uncharacterized protein YaiE (UPF0345 family)